MTDMIKLNFPTIRGFTLRDFSLYSVDREISEKVERGVFCLAGANGLGKSTLVAAINFAITGIVPDPGRQFNSVEEYYKNSRDFCRNYFRGRISEADAGTAEISIVLTVKEKVYEVTRGFFDVGELRELRITAIGEKKPIFDGAKVSPQDRDTEYRNSLTSSIGIAKFEQFAFLQHFIMTFDERRHLLFWDPRVLQQTLFLAFGVDHTTATQADYLYRKSEKDASNARNAKWQATQLSAKIKDIIATSESLSLDDGQADLETEYAAINAEIDKCEMQLQRLEDQKNDKTLRLAQLSAHQASLRAEFASEFSARANTTTHVQHHPLITSSINEGSCGLCGGKAADVAEQVRMRVKSKTCPICGGLIEVARERSKDLGKMKALDSQLADTKREIDEALRFLTRVSAEIESASTALDRAKEVSRQFEKRNKRFIASVSVQRQPGSITDVISAYKTQMEELNAKAKAYYRSRDEAKRELKKLQSTLEKRYVQAESEFVPLFKELAFSFIGLDLSVQLESRSSAEMTLVLEVLGSSRREQHQLSESQRFFIDIALRMALVQFMSAQQDGMLFIDTPEGSLDIAYENRAGKMLATFSENGFDIFMTANINSSRLLLSLAERLGLSKMQLCRMTSWADLSDVQQAEEELFEKAYHDIESAQRRSPQTKKRTAKGQR